MGMLQKLGGQLWKQAGQGVGVATLSASRTLSGTSAQVQHINPSGADRNAILPALGVNGHGQWFYIKNTGATYNIVVKKSDGTTTVTTILPGMWALVVSGKVSTTLDWYVTASSPLSTDALSGASLTLTGLLTSVGISAKGPISLKDATDATKILSFVMSSIGTGQTRTLTMPDANVNLADVGTNTTAIAKFGSSDGFVRSTVAVADASGGATTAALTLQLTRADATNVASARQVYIVSSLTQYRGNPSGSATYGTATVGAIIASGTGWCLAQTNATGAFACTVTDAADETLYFSVISGLGGVSVAGEYAAVIGSNSDAATWSA